MADGRDSEVPPGALYRLGTQRLRPNEMVRELAFSPDGKELAALLATSEVTVWEVATGRLLANFRQPGEEVSLRFSQRGRLLATGLDEREGTLSSWEVAAGKKSVILKLPTECRQDKSPALSPDGKMIAAIQFTKPWQLVLCDVASAKPVRRIRMPEGQVDPVVFTPDGRAIATGHLPETGGPSEIRLWDVGIGKERRRIGGHAARIVSMAFTPDGKRLVSAALDDTVRLWDVASGRELRRLESGVAHLRALAVSPNGQLLALSGGTGVIGLLNLATGKEVGPGGGHRGPVLSVSFSPDGRQLATGGEDRDVRLWHAVTGQPWRVLSGHAAPVLAVTFSPDGRLIASGDDGRLRGFQSRASAVRLWQMKSGKTARRWRAAPGVLTLALDFAPDGRTLAVGDSGPYERNAWQGELRLWDTRTGKELLRRTGLGGGLTCVAFAPQGTLLATGTDQLRVQLWDAAAGAALRQMALPPPPRPRGDIDEKRPEAHLATTGLAFTPDGRTLLGMEGHQRLYVWEVATGRLRDHQELHWRSQDGDMTRDMALSPDGRLLATSDNDYRVCLWDLGAVRLLHRFVGHRDRVASLAFSADGRRLASASRDSTVLVWDVSGLYRQVAPGRAQLKAAELDALWADLARDDAAQAYHAIVRLRAAAAQAVPYLGQHLRPAPKADATVIARLIADLDATSFAARQKATAALQTMGDPAEPALRRALETRPSGEARRRLEKLLAALKGPERLREQRALEALEHAGTPEARRLLQKLAQGAPEASLTREAKAAADRLARRSPD